MPQTRLQKYSLKNIFLTLFILTYLPIHYSSSTYAGEIAATDSNININKQWFMSSSEEWLMMFRPGTRGGNGRTLFYTDYFIPVAGTNEILFFINPKLVWGDDKGNEQNIGCGIRNLVFDDKLILGGNFYYDTRKTMYGNRFNQIGFGAEALSKRVDLRGNFYLHLSDEKIAKQNITYGFGSKSLIRNTATSYEEPLTGLDYEAGLLIPYISDYIETKVYIGGYNYFPKSGKTINGIRGRIEIRPTPMITIDAEVSGDNMSPAEGYIGGYVSLPFSIGDFLNGKNPFKGWKEVFAFGKGTRPLRERMTDMVVRDIDVVLEGSSTIAETKEHDLTYVDNSNTTGVEDGTQDNPYNTIQEGVANVIGDKWVYINQGNSNYAEYVTLSEGVTIWGSGYDGGFNGVSASGYPVVDGGGLGQAFTVSDVDNCTVMGVRAQNSINGVILMRNTNSTAVHHCVLQGNLSQGGAINVQAGINETITEASITDNIFLNNAASSVNVSTIGYTTTALIDTITISRNTFSELTPVCIGVYNLNGTVQNVTIEGNTMSGFTSAGILFDSKNSVVLSQNIAVRNNRVMGSGSNGIWIQTDGGAIDDIAVTGNTVSSASTGGVGLIANGSSVWGSAIITNAKVSGNIINNGASAGLVLACYKNGSSLDCEVRNNTITDNDEYGVLVDINSEDVTLTLDMGTETSAGCNSIYNNANADVFSDADTHVVDAVYNWWGQTDDPSSQITGSVNYTPWLTSDSN